MSFSMTPVTGFPPVTPDEFPNFIQFQGEGTNLGGADADTVNFTGSGVTATRGEGENAGTVTVEIEGGGSGGANPTLIVGLEGLTTGNWENSPDFSDWFGDVKKTSTEAVWSDATQDITVSTTGVYQVTIAGRVTAVSPNTWPLEDETLFGSVIDTAIFPERSKYGRTLPGEFLGYSNANSMTWSDSFFVEITDVEQTIVPKLYANKYNDRTDTVSFYALVTVTRLTTGA